MNALPQRQYNIEAETNFAYWQSKPVLQKIYQNFFELISQQLQLKVAGKIIELGGGAGNLKSVIPDCICTDLFLHEGIDQIEDAYHLSFADGSVSNLILFDVWHHLEFPGDALKEFNRVLAKGGRVIIFDPAMSLLGLFIYGCLHPEPLGLYKEIQWHGEPNAKKNGYYSAQGNAMRIFCSKKFKQQLGDWNLACVKKLSAFSYVASGGYSGPQLYPASFFPLMRSLDAMLDRLPTFFATRILVTLEKK